MVKISCASEVSIEKEMEDSYLDYAMSVIIGRALPDVRDGLKPVHRRILFAMRVLRNNYDKPYKKSARVVGDVIGKYHPHGDVAVYDSIVRMAQKFSLRYPLIDGQGNFGSIDGDLAAAMRYTEVRMSKLAHEMFDDLDKETVEWTFNYDESLLEPLVMPAKFPALLVNGSSGIAVGMATNIPPHNLGEIIDGVQYYIDNPDATVKDLMTYIPGPDFPTAGIIHGVDGVKNAYNTGRGILRIRAKIEVEKDEKSNREIIVVTEIPYQVNKARLVEKVVSLIKNKVIDGLSYIRDESDRSGLRIAMLLKRGHIADVVINQLYKHTQMENSFGIIFLAVVENRPCVLNLKQILEAFIIHRRNVVIKRTEFDLTRAESYAHVLSGFKIALNESDHVISMIHKSKSLDEAKKNLVEKFKLSIIQAQAILDMRLNKFTNLEHEKIINKYNFVLSDIKKFREILSNDRMVLDVIKTELNLLKSTFSDNRRTKIIEKVREVTVEDMIAQEDMVVTISSAGYIKRNPVTLYQSQRRGGKGKIVMGTKDEDFVSHLFVASTHHRFLFFTNKGKVYWCKVYDIPVTGRQSLGKAIVNFFNFGTDEKMTAVLVVPKFELNMYVLMATRDGIVKKTNLMAFSRPRVGGIIAINLSGNDELISAKLSNGSQDVFLGSACGKSIRFNESDVRSTGRVASGVRGMQLLNNDKVVGMEVLNRGQTFFAVTENGFGKRTFTDEYPIQKRGGKGVITIKTNKRNGCVVSINLVEDNDDLMLVTDAGKLIRMPVTSTSIISRNTQGVRLIVMDFNEKVMSAVSLSEQC